MSEIVITSIISGLCVAIPSITATITANKRNQELMSYQLNTLRDDVNNLKENIVKIYELEKRISLLEEGVKYERSN